MAGERETIGLTMRNRQMASPRAAESRATGAKHGPRARRRGRRGALRL